MEIKEYVSISNAFRDADRQLKQQKAILANKQYDLTQQHNKLQAAQNNKEGYGNLLRNGAVTKEEYDGKVKEFDREIDEDTRDMQGIEDALYQIKIQVEGFQGQIDVFLNKVKENPEVAQVATELKVKKHKEKLEQCEKAKKRAEDKKKIIEKIKNDPDAQQNLEEILKLGTRITKLNEIVNAKDVDKNSQEYRRAKTELELKVIAINSKKDAFVKIVGGFNKDKKQMTEEVLEDLLKEKAKVGEDGKILVTDMLAERIEKEGQEIGNAERGIEFNENRIQEITGKDPRQAENQGQENLEQEQPEEPKKPGFFKKFKNFLKQLFAKEALLTPGNPERKGQGAQEGKPSPDEAKVSREEQQRAAKKDPEFIKYLRANPEDPLLTRIVEPEPMEPVKNQEQKNDDHEDRE